MSSKNNSIIKIKHCFGCGVCSISCPKNLISLKKNKYGFFQPYISDSQKCVNCGKCTSVCSFISPSFEEKGTDIKTYAAWSKDPIIRYRSSSGGITYEIAKYMLSKGYHIIAVRYNISQNRAEHYIAKNIDELGDSFGSKYIQSYTIDAFKAIEKEQKYVVIGTPCQIASLKKFVRIKKIEKNFIFIDFFCHGVPSYLVWEKYSKPFRHATKISWRNKKNGWQYSYCMSFKKEDGQILYSNKENKDLFYRFFLSNNCLNQACYNDCHFKAFNSSADIKVGDFWGSKYKENNDGISIAVAMTDLGKKILRTCPNIQLHEEDKTTTLEGQLKKHIQKPYYYNITMFLLRSKLNLTKIFYLLQIFKIKTHIYKLIRK